MFRFRSSGLTRSAKVLVPLAVAASLTLAACGSDNNSGGSAPVNGKTEITIGDLSNGAATPEKLTIDQVDEIRNKLPKAILDSGELQIGSGTLPAGFPPLGFVGSDNKTLTGAEPDLARLVAAVFGLKPVLNSFTWENLFVGIDSGKVDVGFSNITDTEERKEKYDFASYRKDELAFLVKDSTDWAFNNDYRNLAGHVVSVGSGTNQERILLEWQRKLKSEGKDFQIKYYPDFNGAQLALRSNKIEIYFGPNPAAAYAVRQSAGTPDAFKVVGTYSGAGATLQGLIAATSKKGSGLAQPLADAINYLIKNGVYGKWLAAWNLTAESVGTSEVNPPGLPKDDS